MAEAPGAASGDALAQHLTLLDLERIEKDIFRGQNRNIGSGRIFGGQVLAQALVAARGTIRQPDREPHSAHGYFILEGDLTVPVVYVVERLRDGGSFTTRRVTAIQRGRAIFNMSASFHKPEAGIEHQVEMPEAPDPENLPSDLDVLRENVHRIPPALRSVLTQERPLDIRSVGPMPLFHREPSGFVQKAWIRAVGPLGDDPTIHCATLAYASDHGILPTALKPHGRTIRDADLMAASLDHAVWFHCPFRMDEWLLYVTKSPVAAGARGFAHGTFFTRSGRLVASAAQEGLLRTGIRRPPPPSAPDPSTDESTKRE
ncbi:MAG: acyl-CoA thioesterase II [Gemmatimonadetes bacterium]|nr:acyl-CoA thioesterase II [Gemmatimonadota bacterium]